MNGMGHLHTLKSMSASGTELQFYLQEEGEEGQAHIFMRTHQPREPQAVSHEARISLAAFADLVQAIHDGLPARPTLDFTGGQVNLHLTTRSRRPGRLSVRSDQSGEVLNFSTLTPVHEEFQRVLHLAQTAGV